MTTRPPRRPLFAALGTAIALAGCTGTPGTSAPIHGTAVATSAATSPHATASAAYDLGMFPALPTAELPPTTVAKLQTVLDQSAPNAVPGITATVLVAGVGAWTGAAGTTDGTTPMERSAQFGIASISKTVIAAEVLSLVESGALRLDDPVAEHLPDDFDFNTNGATVLNLLSMESGIPDPTLTLAEVRRDPLRTWKPEEVLATVPVSRSKPGDHFVYEDANYMLLGLVIKSVTGETVATALRADVLADPLLGRLVYQPEERPSAPLALPFDDAGLRPDAANAGGGYLESRSEASWANGSGGMASDAPALAVFGYRLYGGGMLSLDSVRAMTDFEANDASDRYGLGTFYQSPIAPGLGPLALGNGGWGQGYAAVLTVLPDRGIVIAVLTNRGGDPISQVFPIAVKLLDALG